MEPVTGSWGPQNMGMYAQVKFFEYPIPASGEYSVSVSTTGLQNIGGAPDYLIITRNGTNVDPNASTDPPSRSYTGNFTAGDILSSEVFVMAARTNVTASWTITSDVLDPGDPVDPGEPEGVIEVEEIDMIYFGGDEAEALYRGTLLVWEALSGPQDDAKLWMKFDNQANFLENLGTATTPVNVIGGVTHEWDHARFGSGRLNFTPSSNWYSGFTFSYWTRDTAANSGWETIMHRAVPSGTLTNEAYIVHNTSSTTTTIFSGLKFGSTHNEDSSTYSLPVGVDWFHTVVVWERLTSTTFSCTFYINGVQRGVSNETGYSSSASQFGSEQVWIGGNRTANEWSGRMDDLTLWDRPLSAAEVVEVYNQGRSFVPQITTTSIPNFILNEAYSFYFTSDFGATSWSATGLPQGISLNSASGHLTGTPTVESTGTMTVTASGSGGLTSQRSFPWSVAGIPAAPSGRLYASGAKVSHSGWATPNLTWSASGTGYSYSSSAGYIRRQSDTVIGYIRATSTTNQSRAIRIVSSTRGVLTTSGTSTSNDISTSRMVLTSDDQLSIEINGYSGNTGDRFNLYIEP